MSARMHGAEPLARDLNQLATLLESQALQHKIGLASIRIVRDFTRQGKDAEGRAFPSAPTAENGPYSPGHRRRRERGLGSGKALPVSRKTLEFSEHGGMLSKIDHVVSRDLETVSVIIDDPEKEKIAGFLMQGAGTSRVQHRFFELSDASVGKINTLVDREIDDYLRITSLDA